MRRLARVLAITIASPVPAQGPPPSPVLVDEARVETVQEHRAVSGELRALRRSRVATQEPGLVVALPVEEGTLVKAGEVLARLDSRRLEVLARELEADALAVDGLIEERQATLQWRLRDLELYRASFERGAANVRELRDAESACAIAQAQLRQSQQQREVIRARAELVGERLADTTIVAPYDGVVVAMHAELGEWAAEGAAVVELVSRGRIEAWLEVPQRFFDAVVEARSLPIELEINARRGEASAVRIVPHVDPRSRSFDVVATLDDEGSWGRLAPGMAVTAWVPTGEAAQRLTLPADAVLRNDAGAYVYVARTISEEGPALAAAQPLRVLFRVGGRVVVDAPGISGGDLIIVEGNERLFPMAPVLPQPAAAAGDAGGGP
jgi:RND family efflux transporter MFP subunit